MLSSPAASRNFVAWLASGASFLLGVLANVLQVSGGWAFLPGFLPTFLAVGAAIVITAFATRHYHTRPAGEYGHDELLALLRRVRDAHAGGIRLARSSVDLSGLGAHNRLRIVFIAVNCSIFAVRSARARQTSATLTMSQQPNDYEAMLRSDPALAAAANRLARRPADGPAGPLFKKYNGRVEGKFRGVRTEITLRLDENSWNWGEERELFVDLYLANDEVVVLRALVARNVEVHFAAEMGLDVGFDDRRNQEERLVRLPNRGTIAVSPGIAMV